MSIKIGSAAKNVIDVVFVTSSSAKKNVNKVVDWNGKVIWERITDIPMTKDNTVISISPTSYAEYGSTYSWRFEPTVTGVTVNGKSITTNNYTVSYSNSSGSGTVSKQKATVTVKGKNGYSGSVGKDYEISYTYSEPTYYFYVLFIGNGSTSGTMATQTIQRGVSTQLTANGFSKAGNIFNGWASSSTGSVEYTDKQYVYNLADANQTKTLYAKWRLPGIKSIEMNSYCYYGTAADLKLFDPASSSRQCPVTVTMEDGKVLSLSKSDTGPTSGVTYSILENESDRITAYYKNGKAISGTSPTGQTIVAHLIQPARVTIKCDGTTYSGTKQTGIVYYWYSNVVRS